MSAICRKQSATLGGVGRPGPAGAGPNSIVFFEENGHYVEKKFLD